MRKMWSWSEDEVLISAWLNTGKDAVTNTNQPSSAFWKRIEKYYMENMPQSGVPRAVTQCRNRWHKICKTVSKFVGCYEEANRNKRSGESSLDVFNNAKVIYSNGGNDKEFIYENAWRILKNEPKWMAIYCESSYNSGGSSKRTKTSEDGGYSGSCPATPHTDSDDPAPLVRPPGIKASKKRGKQVQNDAYNSSSTEKFYESSAEFCTSLNQLANVKAQSLKQQLDKMQAYLKAKKMEKKAKMLVKQVREIEKETELLKNKNKKMDMLMMLLSKGEELTALEKMLLDKLTHELF